MTKKLFSLIKGTPIELSAGTKILKQHEFEETLNTAELLEKVQEDAKEYKIQIVKECEKIKEKAEQDGFEEGFKKWSEQLAILEAEILKVRNDLVKMLAPVALKAAQKIVGQELKSSEETIYNIVSTVLKSVSQHKKISIYTSPKDIEIIESKRPLLKNIFENLESLSLRPQEDIDEGGCIIETEKGIINAQLSNQWKILEAAFENIFKEEHVTLKPEEEKK